MDNPLEGPLDDPFRKDDPSVEKIEDKSAIEREQENCPRRAGHTEVSTLSPCPACGYKGEKILRESKDSEVLAEKIAGGDYRLEEEKGEKNESR